MWSLVTLNTGIFAKIPVYQYPEWKGLMIHILIKSEHYEADNLIAGEAINTFLSTLWPPDSVITY